MTKPKGRKRSSGSRKEPAFRQAMQIMIASRWTDVWKSLKALRRSEDPEAVHAVRVASRRLRAAMDAAAEAFPENWYRGLHKTAKDITGSLGDVRDRDVMLERLRAERTRTDEREYPAIDALIQRLDRERDEAGSHMNTYLTELKESGVKKESRRRFPASTRRERGAFGKRIFS